MHRNTIPAAILLAICLSWAGTALAATITVNSLEDDIENDGNCTFREAIIAVNSNSVSGDAPGECAAGDDDPAVDTITFEADLDGAIMLGDNLGSVNEPVFIEGPGADVLALDGSGFATGARMIAFQAASEVHGLTLRNAAALGNSGAIITSGAAPLTIHDCVFEDNQADSGAAIFADSDLVIERTRFSRNTALLFEGGAITLSDIDLTLTIRDSLFEENMTVDPFRDGGAVAVGGTGHNTVISGSTFRANHATGDGGGLSINGDSLSVVNNTFTGNTADRDGGAIETGALDTVLANITVAGNSADADTDGVGNGGGISAPFAAPVVRLRNSLIAANNDDGGQAPDCDGDFTSDGFNLIGVGSFCNGFADGVMGDQVGTGALPIDPGLSALANNGGPTPTMALSFDSPAQEAGDPAGCTDADGMALAVDQRGEPRPVPAATPCDIGAFEASGDAIFFDGFESG